MCVCVCVYIYIYIYIKDIYIYLKKREKLSILNVMNLFMMVKSMLKCFGFIKSSSGLYDGKKLLLEQQWMFLLK